MVPTAAMSGAYFKQFRVGRMPWHLITIHNQDFSDKSRAIKGLVICWMFINLISLGVKILHPITFGLCSFVLFRLKVSEGDLFRAMISWCTANTPDKDAAIAKFQEFKQDI